MGRGTSADDLNRCSPEGRTPVSGSPRASHAQSDDESDSQHRQRNHPAPRRSSGDHNSPDGHVAADGAEDKADNLARKSKAVWQDKVYKAKSSTKTKTAGQKVYAGLPQPLQWLSREAGFAVSKTCGFPHNHMNAPLWAMLIASISSRMLVPMLVMAPLLTVAAKYVSVSILGDPIFAIVSFPMAGPPSVLQLAQICRKDCVCEGVMAKILFQSYVRVIPPTLVLVVCALKVIEWVHAG